MPTDILAIENVHVRSKVEAALYWIREPRAPFQLGYRRDVLRMYAAYWNAFECLVDAVNEQVPAIGLTRDEKTERLGQLLREHYQGRPTAAFIVQAMREIVDTGLPKRAEHALRVSCPDRWQHYQDQCFHLNPPEKRLYNIRNAINHGHIAAEDLEELLRVDHRMSKLWEIVWRMFFYFVRFPAPIPLDQADD